MEYQEKLLPREKVFRDPVLNYIYVQHQVILDLINTKEFQRLRRIKQLGPASYTFHGAEHSRFTHSLGVYEITRRICDGFLRNYPSKVAGDGLWDDSQRLVALCAALLHDIGHGAYSHTFEHIFGTNHEAITQEIITSEKTEVNQVLSKISPNFPKEVASVIDHTYPNQQVVQMISSQCDADRMDYLLRDAYNTGANYGNFDLTRILRVMRPYEGGICFEINGMHAVEDYIISRLQMYMQVYFHPVSRSMEVILSHLLQRAKELASQLDKNDRLTPHLLMPFFKNDFTIDDYLKLDDGVLNTYFINWIDSDDKILSDLADRFINRKPLKSVEYNNETESLIPTMQKWIQEAGFETTYYTAVNNSFDLPYDAYDPNKKHHATQIELRRNDGTMIELSKISQLVSAVTGKHLGDERFFFPKEMLSKDSDIDLFEPVYQEFQKHIKNDELIK
ncbi:HD domain-containing protein [Lactobacillus kunkeei]|uniref:HD domain-containing protein n=1 Tax=Apilactobacillus nanyangensis TaxID=2799579 RepID=A0ABT0HYV3_9LACO|nr:HD domain-containing protein [Apilactobacillus nanyangensis]MBC6389130.1 HD domain-containing protein [Apilactobacillus kunkeei]MCK8612106.1 HD domain-containing protein [Apilactobacillus nanyangensis]